MIAGGIATVSNGCKTQSWCNCAVVNMAWADIGVGRAGDSIGKQVCSVSTAEISDSRAVNSVTIFFYSYLFLHHFIF